MIDREYLTRTIVDLVQINSINPSLIPGAPGEGEIAAYTAMVLRNIGVEVEVTEPAPGRFNVIGRLPGTGGGKSLMLNAHLDTVGVDGMTDPFSGDIRDSRVYGRGSQDMKASLAAMLTAVKTIVDEGVELSGDLIITGVADEEFASIGAEDIVKHVQADAAIVTEPTDLGICRAHRGFIWYVVETLGRAAHGSRFTEGIDANMRMGRFLAELDVLEKDLRERTPHPLAGPPSLHAAMIQGGVEPSVYSAKCTLKVERRTVPGETEASARGDFQAIIDRLTFADPTFKASLSAEFVRDPFEVSADAGIVQALDHAWGSHMGKAPAHTGQTYWTDAAIFAAAGMETVLLGPVGAGLHSIEEWVDIDSTVDLAEILVETAKRYCG